MRRHIPPNETSYFTRYVVHSIGYYGHEPLGKVLLPLLRIGYSHTVGKRCDSFRITFRQR